jgi:hypothetical protein
MNHSAASCVPADEEVLIMKHVFVKTLAGTGLLLFGLTAHAQPPPREYQYQESLQANLHQTCDRIQSDLDRADARTLPLSPARARVDAARDELRLFERSIDDGYADGRGFERMVSAVHRVAELNSMPDWTRDALTADLVRLQDLWGSR